MPGRVLAQEKTNAAAARPRQGEVESLDDKQNEEKEARLKARMLIDAARVDMENGRLENAENKLHGALELDPNQRAANYYLTLIRERRGARQNASLQPVYPVIRKSTERYSLEFWFINGRCVKWLTI